MKRYIKPLTEVIKSETESLLSVSLPKGQDPVNPSDALAPLQKGLTDDDDFDVE